MIGKEMEKIFEQGLLYDFYGELLTPHQRSVYEDAVYNDMSLGEIAQEKGISRQGVHDLIKRCDKILQDYESKLHLVSKFSDAREKVSEIVSLTGHDTEETDKDSEYRSLNNRAECNKALEQEKMQRIRELSLELLKEW